MLNSNYSTPNIQIRIPVQRSMFEPDNYLAVTKKKQIKDEKKARDYWSNCGLINFVDGKGWGVDEQGKTWPLGKEVDVIKAMETGELPDYLNPHERRVLCHVLELRKKVLENEPKEYKPRRAVGSRPAGTFKCRKENTRQAKTRRKPALHKIG